MVRFFEHKIKFCSLTALSFSGLDLNGYDAFPLIVERLLARTYSILDVQRQMPFEIISTLEHILATSERYKYNGISRHAIQTQVIQSDSTTDSNSAAQALFNGHKVLLFTQFLTEEYDCDIVALFLAKREIIQNILTIRFKDIHTTRIWASTQPESDEKIDTKTPLKSKRKLVGSEESKVQFSKTTDMTSQSHRKPQAQNTQQIKKSKSTHSLTTNVADSTNITV
jgi:hypothetical protein